MKDETITVLLVDDHDIVRLGFRSMLEKSRRIDVIGEASNGEEAAALYVSLKPDVVVMDISMPVLNGVDALARILKSDKAARVLIFSVTESEIVAVRLLKAGAKGYLTKRAAADQLIEAVEAVAANQLFLPRELAAQVVEGISNKESDPMEKLLAREFEIFMLLAEGKSSLEIAELLNLSVTSISKYIGKIKSKLGVENSSDMARLAIRTGLMEP